MSMVSDLSPSPARDKSSTGLGAATITAAVPSSASIHTVAELIQGDCGIRDILYDFP